MLVERQRLLSSLNKELRSSPMYSGEGVDHVTSRAASHHKLRVFADESNQDRQPLTTFNSIRKSYLGDGLSSFNAFHTEVDPYKSFTTSARLVPTNNSDNQGVDAVSSGGSTAGSQSDDMSLGGTGVASGKNGPIAQVGEQGNHSANLLTGPLTNLDALSATRDLLRTHKGSQANEGGVQANNKEHQGGILRVRRDDSEDREDADDDGVWVDDDDDDDNRQQSSDLNETAQEPEEEGEDDGQQDAADTSDPQGTSQLNPPGVIGGPHGYELSPNDLMIYNG